MYFLLAQKKLNEVLFVLIILLLFSLSGYSQLPTFTNQGLISLCVHGSYFLAPSPTNGTWASTHPEIATVNSSGYITGISISSQITEISLTNNFGTVTATVTVVSNSNLSITDPFAQSSYKFDYLKHGPTDVSNTINYVGYNGFKYSSQTPPINPGFYRANIQSGNDAGCPNEYYIIKCDGCSSNNNNIVQNGLILNLDAANSASYSGFGNIWTDLSGNGINAIFGSKSPTFSNDFGGVFNFDGTQNMTLPLNDLPYGKTSFTLNTWAKVEKLGVGCQFIFSYGDGGGGARGVISNHARFLGTCDNVYHFGGFGSNDSDVLGPLLVEGIWFNMTGTYDWETKTAILYLNGVEFSRENRSWDTMKNSGFVGRQVDGYNEFWHGSISNIQLYNRSLTKNEVLINYNALKSRFSL